MIMMKKLTNRVLQMTTMTVELMTVSTNQEKVTPKYGKRRRRRTPKGLY